MKQVFHNSTYDLNKTVENELDFLLGAVLGLILERERNAMYLVNRQINPTNEESIWVNHFLFSSATDLKDLIRKLLQV